MSTGVVLLELAGVLSGRWSFTGFLILLSIIAVNNFTGDK